LKRNPFTRERLGSLRGFTPLLIVLIVPRTLVGLGASLIIPFMNLYFKDIFALPGPQIGLIYTFGQLATAAGMLLVPLVVRRLGKVRTVVITELFSLTVHVYPRKSWLSGIRYTIFSH